MPRLTETRARRASLPKNGQAFIWCSEVKGFAVRLMPSGVRTWIVQLRYRGKSMRLTLGRVGVLPFEGPSDTPGARDLAIAALNAARRGEDPKIAIRRAQTPDGITIGGLWTKYAAAGYPKLNGETLKRASSVKVDTYRWGKHFAPKIAAEPVAAFDTGAATRWLDTIRDPGAKANALILLKTLLKFGKQRGLCEPLEIALTPKRSNEIANYLKPDELRRLDAALIALSEEKPEQLLGFAAIRLLLHSGMRKSEVLTLRWSMVDATDSLVRLAIDKASEVGRTVLLTAHALAILRTVPRMQSNDYVFFGRTRGSHLRTLEYAWALALQRAGLKRVRLHDLRHSFAATAISRGTSLYVTGKLLGHRSSRTTERYAHLSAEAAREALDRVAGALS